MMISILFSIKKHNSSSNSSSNNNTIYSVCLVMDPHEVSRERERERDTQTQDRQDTVLNQTNNAILESKSAQIRIMKKA